ncbi:MBL fold metallo-hydrolase [Aureivirga marina]|uniref:MBL fold metallo-hydrolase n=1 Tax=Aureivirga marina TaxID=1182451 RepID=UPI0018C9F92C|nr:MBL fold metallo-hydrolase [Aureivirga marina]
MKIQLETKDIIIFESSLYRTTSTLIDTENTLFLVDPNYLPLELEFIQQKVKERRGSKKLVLLITHADYDHIIGVNAFDYDALITTETFLTKRDIEKALYDLEAFEQSFYIHRDFELSYPVPTNLIKKNNQEFLFNSISVHGFLAPGHTIDSGFFIIKPLNILIAGDYLIDIEIPMIDDNLKDYKNTLDLFENLIENEDFSLVISGHGDYAKSKETVLKRIALDKEYLKLLEENVYQKQPFDLEFLKNFPNPIEMKAIHLRNVKNLVR